MPCRIRSARAGLAAGLGADKHRIDPSRNPRGWSNVTQSCGVADEPPMLVPSVRVNFVEDL
jgi:hypothetical protein